MPNSEKVITTSKKVGVNSKINFEDLRIGNDDRYEREIFPKNRPHDEHSSLIMFKNVDEEIIFF